MTVLKHISTVLFSEQASVSPVAPTSVLRVQWLVSIQGCGVQMACTVLTEYAGASWQTRWYALNHRIGASSCHTYKQLSSRSLRPCSAWHCSPPAPSACPLSEGIHPHICSLDSSLVPCYSIISECACAGSGQDCGEHSAHAAATQASRSGARIKIQIQCEAGHLSVHSGHADRDAPLHQQAVGQRGHTLFHTPGCSWLKECSGLRRGVGHLPVSFMLHSLLRVQHEILPSGSTVLRPARSVASRIKAPASSYITRLTDQREQQLCA